LTAEATERGPQAVEAAADAGDDAPLVATDSELDASGNNWLTKLLGSGDGDAAAGPAAIAAVSSRGEIADIMHGETCSIPLDSDSNAARLPSSCLRSLCCTAGN
ncbi:hypothetical protein Vafri_219, partial [Volvox africanus]